MPLTQEEVNSVADRLAKTDNLEKLEQLANSEAGKFLAEDPEWQKFIEERRKQLTPLIRPIPPAQAGPTGEPPAKEEPVTPKGEGEGKGKSDLSF